MSNTKTIAKNTGWYGLENVIGIVVSLFTSIAIARTLGPSKMGYMIYVTWISTTVGTLGGMGIPSTTRKYMAEFLGMGDRGTGRYIYFRTLFLQMGMATFATAGILIWILRDANPEYALAAALVGLSIWPAMVNYVSAQANVAAETLSANLPASVVSILVYFIGIAGTVLFKWGVVGVGASMFAMRASDFLVRFFPTMHRICGWEIAHVRPNGLGRRMLTFAWQSVASMVISMIVWDRSEFVLLKKLCSDIRQVAYYSVAFGLADRLLLSATVFGSATSATIFAQYGRDRSRLPGLVSSAFRYLALTSVPFHVIAVALAVPLLLVLYGHQYNGAAVVVTVAPLLCMPRVFRSPVESLLQSGEKQIYVIGSTIFAGVADMTVAWFLIPSMGALGACIGSGTAQIMAVGVMWAVGIRLYKVELPWQHLVKIFLSSALAAIAAHYVAIQFAPLGALIFGGAASIVVLLGSFYVLGVLEPDDSARFRAVSSLLPTRLARPMNALAEMMVRRHKDRGVPVEQVNGVLTGEGISRE